MSGFPMRLDPPYKFYPKVLSDDVGGGVIYVGSAAAGTATSDDKWQIKKITTTASTATIVFAGGKPHFDQVWNNRTSLSYS